jgi:regulator of protease activity HflC (stomatin/prohibitin superfamily)
MHMDENEKKALMFFGLIGGVILGAILFSYLATRYTFQLMIVIALGITILIMWKTEVLIKLKEYERAVIFRFGKVARVGGPGWTLKLPIIETYRKVDLRVKTLDVEKQDVITKDMIELKIDAVIYLRVRKDPQSVINSIIEVEDYRVAARTYVIAAIRDAVGDMTLPELIANIDKLNERLKAGLSKITEAWGVAIVSVEIKDVDVPEVIVKAMHQEKAAVQEKLAVLQRAEAKRREIEAVNSAARELSDATLGYYYIKALEEMSRGKSTKLIFPLEFSNLVRLLGSKVLAGVPRAEQGLSKDELMDLIREAVEKHTGNAVKNAVKKGAQ